MALYGFRAYATINGKTVTFYDKTTDKKLLFQNLSAQTLQEMLDLVELSAQDFDHQKAYLDKNGDSYFLFTCDLATETPTSIVLDGKNTEALSYILADKATEQAYRINQDIFDHKIK